MLLEFLCPRLCGGEGHSQLSALWQGFGDDACLACVTQGGHAAGEPVRRSPGLAVVMVTGIRSSDRMSTG